MTSAILLATCALLAGAVVALLVALLGAVRRLETRLTALETRGGFETGARAPSSTTGLSAPSTSEEFVITRLGEESEPAVPMMEPKLFADVVLRESVVKAASWAYAVRRGLSPANRNRIRFEMRRELKRARKERKAEEREAIRQYRARKRAAVRESEAA